MKEKEIKRKRRKKNKRLNIERTETTRCFSFRMVKETRENEFEWVKWKSKVFSLLIHDEFGHHRNKLNDIKTRLLTNAFVQERIAIHSRPFHPSFHSPPPPFFPFSNSISITMLVKSRPSSWCSYPSYYFFYLLPFIIFFFLFIVYRPITHTVHVYNSNTDGIFQENNTKKKERKKKNQITIIEAQTSREIKNFTIHRIIDGKILTIRSQTISSNTGNVSKQLHGYPSIFPQIHRPLSAAITMTMQSYRSK